MSEASVECRRERLHIEILGHFFAIAAPESSELTALVALEAKIREPIRRLDPSTRIGGWIYMQRVCFFVFAPLEFCKNNFDVSRVDLFDRF